MPCYYKGEPEEIKKLCDICVHPCYTLDNKILFVVPNGIDDRYFDRIKKNGEYDITDALVY